MKFILFLSVPLYALDQLTKQWVLRFISPYDARVVVPDFFNLVNVTNTGAAFGSFKGNNIFFVIISIIALVVVTVLLVRHNRSDPWRDIYPGASPCRHTGESHRSPALRTRDRLSPF